MFPFLLLLAGLCAVDRGVDEQFAAAPRLIVERWSSSSVVHDLSADRVVAVKRAVGVGRAFVVVVAAGRVVVGRLVRVQRVFDQTSVAVADAGHAVAMDEGVTVAGLEGVVFDGRVAVVESVAVVASVVAVVASVVAVVV